MNPLLQQEKKTPGKWWTDFLHLTYGCTKVSDGCKNCWADRLAPRIAKGIERLRGECASEKWKDRTPREWPFVLEDHAIANHRSTNKIWFVSPMGDLFHEAISDKYIIDCFRMMDTKPGQYVVLTKRSERMAMMFGRREINLSENIHVGISIEDNNNYFRMYDLIHVGNMSPKYQRLVISFEPLLDSLDPWMCGFKRLSKDRTVTVIVGCESGKNRREPPPMSEVLKIKTLCAETGCDFILKQWCKPRNGKEAEQLRIFGRNKEGGIKLL